MSMVAVQLAVFLTILLLVAVLTRYLTRDSYLPVGLFLLVLGYLLSELVIGLGFDTGIRWYILPPLILNGLLPALIFRAALELKLEQIRRQGWTIVLLALPFFVVMVAITAATLYYGISHPWGFPWLAAWLAAALLTATDPGMIINLLKRAGAERIAVILEGESLLSDTTAIVLFSLLIGAAVAGIDPQPTVTGISLEFVRVLVVGGLIGVLCGALQSLLLKLILDGRLLATASLVLVYGGYWLSEQFAASGIITVLIIGLIFNYFAKARARVASNTLTRFWSLLADLSEYGIYLLAGVTVTLTMFRDMWLAMLIAIVAVLLARTVTVLVLLPLGQRLVHGKSQPFGDQLLVTWGGLRGVVTLALALSLPIAIDYWYTVQSMAYGVVLFSLFIQAGGLVPLLRARIRTERLFKRC